MARIAISAATAAAAVALLASCGLVDRSDRESQEAAAHLNEAYGLDMTGEEYEGVAYGAFHLDVEIDGQEMEVRICDPEVAPTEVILCTNDDQNPTPVPIPGD
jgi:diphthamide synthase (EF-2-diphthine--ammonia ligase)